MFQAKMQTFLGDEYAAFEAAFQQSRVNSLRLNPQKLEPSALRTYFPNLEHVPWCETGFYVPFEARAGSHVLHALGAYYVQEASAMAVAQILEPEAGECVLDLCAAPGGKSTHLASLMHGQGLLVSNEIVQSRARILAENLERLGLPAVVMNEDPARLAAAWGSYFDRILVDAPCSGEGMFRKNPDAALEWSEASVLACSRRQTEILDSAAQLLKPGGTMVYSTCTFSIEENEEVIERFLEEHPEFELINIFDEHNATDWGFDFGRNGVGAHGHASAVSHGNASITDKDLILIGRNPKAHSSAPLQFTARLWAHKLRGEGHFIAKLRKISGEDTSTELEFEAFAQPFKAKLERKSWLEFQKDYSVPDKRFAVFRGEVQLIADETPPLETLKVVRAGVPMAEVKAGRLEPHHALSHWFARGKTDIPVLDLELSDPRVQTFLRGETIQSEGAAGWIVVRVLGLGLAWGKRVGSTIKNHYPKHLRDSRINIED
jgi:NOL1/NOP2/sun family putative RNA methylase